MGRDAPCHHLRAKISIYKYPLQRLTSYIYLYTVIEQFNKLTKIIELTVISDISVLIFEHVRFLF